MGIFKNLVIDKASFNRSITSNGIPLNRFSEKIPLVVNPVRNHKYYTVSGRPGSGKRSFTDLYFLLGTYIYWKNLPFDSRPEFKVFYYNMDKTPDLKLQKMLCTYLWIEYQKLMDVNTLNGTSARLYDIKPEDEAYILAAEEFFDDMMNIIEFKHGRVNPTGIYNDTLRYMRSIGSMEVQGYEKKFILNPEHEDQITLVIVDNVEKLGSESKNGVHYRDYELHGKMNEMVKEVVEDYPVSFLLIIPSFEVPGIVSMKQMKPDFREFKYYFSSSDVAMHLYNPAKYEQEDYGGFKVSDWNDPYGIQRLRILSIMRNTEAGDNMQIPLAFIPENGYFYDLPSPSDVQNITGWKTYLNDFRSKYIYNVQ